MEAASGHSQGTRRREGTQRAPGPWSLLGSLSLGSSEVRLPPLSRAVSYSNSSGRLALGMRFSSA